MPGLVVSSEIVTEVATVDQDGAEEPLEVKNCPVLPLGINPV